MYTRKLRVLVAVLFVLFTAAAVSAQTVPPATETVDPTASELTADTVTLEDIGIDANGQAPMILTDANGEPLSGQFQVVNDGVNEKFRIAEDSTDVSITEHSVIYNTGAMESAGLNTGEPDVQWTVTNNGTGETANAGSGSTEYAGVFKTPGFFNLGNSGTTPVDSSTVVSSGSAVVDPDAPADPNAPAVPGAVESGTDVELEVVDITAPSMRVMVTPEDTHTQNTFFIREDPDNLDAYPITSKTAKVTVEGKNWTSQGAAGSNAPVDINFVTNFGMVSEEDLPNVNDSLINPDIQALNEYTVDSSLDSTLGEGFYVPVSVRTNFDVLVEDDNDPRAERQAQVNKTWKLVIEKNGETEVIKETPSYIFRIPNYQVADGPKYTFVAESIDGTGNSILCRIPIIVMPKDLDIKNIDSTSNKMD